MLITTVAFGQSKADTLKQKHNESVTIYGSSRPVTGEALKIGRKPRVPSLQISTVPEITSFPDIKVPTTIRLKEIKPASYIPTAQQVTLWKNLLTLGIGSRISPLLEYFYSGGKPKKHQLTVHLLHHSSFLNIKDYLPSPYTYSKAGISYDKYFPYHVLAIRGDYRISSNRYYGYNTKGDTLNYDKNDASLKQYYQVATMGIKFGSNYRSEYRLNHLFRANGYYLSDKHGMSETNGHFDFDLHKGFRVSKIFNHQQLGIGGGFDYFKNKAAGLPQGYQTSQDYYARLFPYFDARYGIFSFKAGLNFEWLKQAEGKLHFYPYLHVNVNVAPGIFSFFAGLDGGLKKNSYLDLSRENPYLSSSQNDFRWGNTLFEAYGGFRGNIVRRFGFEFRAGYRKFSDMPYFDHPTYWYPFYSGSGYTQNSTGTYTPPKKYFYLFYANGHVLDLSGSLTYANTPNLNIWLKGEYHSYTLDNNLEPLYKPLFSMRFGASYQIKKIKPWIEVNFMDRQWATKEQEWINPWLVTTNSQSPYYKLDKYFDINLGAEYRIDKQLSGFIRVTNLLNKQYFRYDGYPVAGLEIMVGIRYRF
jgi:hypothetical protein